jgi:hypothetical protein
MKLGTYLSVSAAYMNRILGVYVMRRHAVLLLNVVRKDATLRLNMLIPLGEFRLAHGMVGVH